MLTIIHLKLFTINSPTLKGIQILVIVNIFTFDCTLLFYKNKL